MWQLPPTPPSEYVSARSTADDAWRSSSRTGSGSAAAPPAPLRHFAPVPTPQRPPAPGLNAKCAAKGADACRRHDGRWDAAAFAAGASAWDNIAGESAALQPLQQWGSHGLRGDGRPQPQPQTQPPQPPQPRFADALLTTPEVAARLHPRRPPAAADEEHAGRGGCHACRSYRAAELAGTDMLCSQRCAMATQTQPQHEDHSTQTCGASATEARPQSGQYGYAAIARRKQAAAAAAAALTAKSQAAVVGAQQQLEHPPLLPPLPQPRDTAQPAGAVRRHSAADAAATRQPAASPTATLAELRRSQQGSGVGGWIASSPAASGASSISRPAGPPYRQAPSAGDGGTSRTIPARSSSTAGKAADASPYGTATDASAAPAPAAAVRSTPPAAAAAAARLPAAGFHGRSSGAAGGSTAPGAAPAASTAAAPAAPAAAAASALPVAGWLAPFDTPAGG